MSDHPPDTETPFDRLQRALADGVYDLRPDDSAVLVRLDDDDYALVERAGVGRQVHAVRVSIDNTGFLAAGQWESLGEIVCDSGRLRIGHRWHRDAGVVLSVPRASVWTLERYVESDYGSAIGLQVRRAT